MLHPVITLLPIALVLGGTPPHDGPDPVGSWLFTKPQVSGQTLNALRGVSGKILGKPTFVADPRGASMMFDGRSDRVVLAEDFRRCQQKLPKRHLTIEAWVAVNTPTRWGGILGLLQDNGEAEKGFVLGYNETGFTFGLATKGADDGDGHMTYLAGRTRYEPGRFYHVVATYDGARQLLYVNGKLDGESKVQNGDILYPDHAPFVLAGYQDANESHPFHGRLRSVRLFEHAAKPKWVQHAFAADAALTRARPHVWIDPEHRWVVHPYLQWGTVDGMTIRWETSRPSDSVVRFGTKVDWADGKAKKQPRFAESRRIEKPTLLHEVRIDGLQPGTADYYQATSTDDQGRVLTGAVCSFQTAPVETTPFAFAVISDTQGNPEVSGRMAELAWRLRPSFLLHPGDLVDTGTVKKQWVEEFFRSLRPLTERVPFYPVLGNHERDARFYYDYMSLPAPEYYYTFRFGNAQFFMLDSNREVGPGSEQYRFLAKALAASRAEWKIVCYHHPAYSSDENDYGDTWSGPTTAGDLRTRKLVTLFDKHGVDLVWNGHIHSYERTWPLRGDRATDAHNGTVYMITGGGGGSLETPGPVRPFFQNTVRRGHHFCFVAVNGKTLEMKAYDLEGQLFDMLRIEKKSK